MDPSWPKDDDSKIASIGVVLYSRSFYCNRAIGTPWPKLAVQRGLQVISAATYEKLDNANLKASGVYFQWNREKSSLAPAQLKVRWIAKVAAQCPGEMIFKARYLAVHCTRMCGGMVM